MRPSSPWVMRMTATRMRVSTQNNRNSDSTAPILITFISFTIFKIQSSVFFWLSFFGRVFPHFSLSFIVVYATHTFSYLMSFQRMLVHPNLRILFLIKIRTIFISCRPRFYRWRSPMKIRVTNFQNYVAVCSSIREKCRFIRMSHQGSQNSR